MPPDDRPSPRSEAIDEEIQSDDHELAWWRAARRQFEEYDLPPYKPPRFEDGVLTPILIDSLEQRLGVDVTLIGVNTRYGDDWEIRVDDQFVDSIGRRRDSNGYTVFETSSDAFVETVADFCRHDERS